MPEEQDVIEVNGKLYRLIGDKTLTLENKGDKTLDVQIGGVMRSVPVGESVWPEDLARNLQRQLTGVGVRIKYPPREDAKAPVAPASPAPKAEKVESPVIAPPAAPVAPAVPVETPVEHPAAPSTENAGTEHP